jgi:hypothetical protein
MADRSDNGPDAPRAVRAFGAMEDLDVNFVAPRPYVVSAILGRCAADAQTPWRWTVPRRTQALLAVAQACGVDALTALARCPSEHCGDTLELDLELASFVTGDARERCAVNDGTRSIELRVPTGDDQRRWLESVADAADLNAAMALSLVTHVNGEAVGGDFGMSAQTLEAIGRELEACDPITALDVAAACPGCSATVDVEIDLEGLLLDVLARTQRDMLDSVHRLASRYHWSEAEVLALPAWRRAYYLAAIAGAV